jgi:hypothetical protein
MEEPLPEIIQEYTQIAYTYAGIKPTEWQPESGYKFNRAVLDKLYYYYRDLYFKNQSQFLWAGLARMTGGQVMYGMDNITRIAKDPCVLTVQIVAVAKAIFENMSWQHELYMEDRSELLSVCAILDNIRAARYSYTRAWEHIIYGDELDIAKGNKMLLENEQYNTIQPHYETIKKDRYAARYFWFTRFAMRNIHPYHKRFIMAFPFKDVTIFKDRWQWIDGNKGMWQTWVAASLADRSMLVALSNEEIIGHQWPSWFKK